MSQFEGHSATGRIRSLEKSNDLVRNPTRDILACNNVQEAAGCCLPPELLI
jgi:hypothetical protein